jgi:zinc protease
MRYIAVLALALLTFPAQAKTFNAEQFTLDNGMQVVVIPNHRAPVVTHMLWFKVGAADELPGRSGMAHYLEHLLFKGTEKQAPGEFSKTVKTLGGNENAFTSQDYTAYYESIAVANLPKIMEMEADRVQNLKVPNEHYQSEKSVVLEERRQRTDNEPRAIFGEQINSTLYINHPYANPVVGWMSEIEKYEWADVKSFYDQWYAPNNAILVISGDITAKQVKPLAEKYYGALKPKEIPERIRPQIPPGNSKTLITLQHETVQQPAFQKTYLAPTEARNRSDSLALQVLSEIMDGGPTTRLYKTLVVDAKKATNVGMNYNSNALDYGSISLYATPAENVSLTEIQKLVEQEIIRVLNEGVSEQEVKEAVQRLQDEAVFARDSLAGPAMIFGAALTTGSSIDDIENWPDDIAKVTAGQVKEVAEKYLNDASPWIRPAVTGHMLPPEAKDDANVQ